MTRILDRMEADGLIERLRHPEDRRGLLIGLTAEGRRRYGDVAREHLQRERALLDALSAEDQAQLADLLRKLLISLERMPDADDRRVRRRPGRVPAPR